MSVQPYQYNFSFYVFFADYHDSIGHYDLGHSTGKKQLWCKQTAVTSVSKRPSVTANSIPSSSSHFCNNAGLSTDIRPTSQM